MTDAQSDRAVRVGVVGTGGIANLHLLAFHEYPDSLELGAVCDIREDAAQAFAESADGDVAVYESFESLLDDPNIDAVDLCTPHDLHAPQAIAAAGAGKHVLVEKPMACSVDECRAMVAAADAAGVTLMVAQSLRYLPASRAVRDIIAAGALGDVWSARADDWFPGAPPAEWMRDAKRSGGGVLHMGSTHHIDLLRYFLGDVATVTARCWTHDTASFTNGAEDRAVATLEFESGAVAHLSASWGGKTPHFFQYMIFGQDGSLHTPLPADAHSRATMLAQHHATPLIWTAQQAEAGNDHFVEVEATEDGFVGSNPFTNELMHFAQCVRDGTEPLSSGRDNLGTMKVIYGCYESASSGQPVDLAAI